LFAFRIRPNQGELILEGSSLRYTAIALIGLAGEDEAVQSSILAGVEVEEACGRLVRRMAESDNLGDVALTFWATCAVGSPDERRSIEQRLIALKPDQAAHPTVEVAWALSALCADARGSLSSLCTRVARRLMTSFEAHSAMFPHKLGQASRGARRHVSCFADMVYPIHALAVYSELSGNPEARDIVLRCASRISSLQGSNGQWWWHYDRRSGAIVERYPVYAVHQDAMAPMALFAIESATRVDLHSSIARGLGWLAHAPELGGRSLVDVERGIIWRKVARREPAKLNRYVQALASRLHPSFRMPGLDLLFRPSAVDYEDRPYHLGWLLYAWPKTRVASLSQQATSA